MERYLYQAQETRRSRKFLHVIPTIQRQPQYYCCSELQRNVLHLLDVALESVCNEKRKRNTPSFILADNNLSNQNNSKQGIIKRTNKYISTIAAFAEPIIPVQFQLCVGL